MYANQTRANGDTPQHPLPSAMGTLDATINGLAATIDNLVTRLSPVLRPSLPEPGEKVPSVAMRAVEPANSSVTQEVQTQAARLERLVNQLNDATLRLEV